MSSWTADKINLLMSLAREGFSAAQIAERMRSTRNAVLGKVHRLGCKLIDLNGDKRTARFPHGGRAPRRAPRRPPVAKMAAPPETPAVTVVPVESATQPCTLMDLQPDSCKWPINDGNPFLFCGAPRRDDGPYCEHHARKAYAPTKK
jgi:GcrA cell cycle regulator